MSGGRLACKHESPKEDEKSHAYKGEKNNTKFLLKCTFNINIAKPI